MFLSVIAGIAVLIHHKGFAIRTLAHGGIRFVGTYLDLVQRAVIGSLHMIAALGNGAGNTVVCSLVFHDYCSCI